MPKLKVLLHSNYCGIKTGFGGFVREVLTYLHKTGKYELVLLAAGIVEKHPEFNRWPWRVIGVLPNDPKQLELLQRDPNLFKNASYGSEAIDRVIQQERPDVYIGIEDPWGLDYCKDKPWWNKIGCVVHSTIDSRPLLPSIVELAKQTEHFYSWADFATLDFHKIGLDHVKTLRGTVNTNVYRRLPAQKREELRLAQGIPKDAFCVGMLSRNQLRKSFPTVLEGYKMFRDKNPQIKEARLLLFTHFGEGWNIPDRIKEFGIEPAEVLCCYKCRATGQYFLRPFSGQDLDNPITGHKKSLVTVNIQDGLTDEQVNEWYNLLDVYTHAFTSGGQERSIQEAKLTELITLVTNYSCGEDSCVPEAASIPLEYAPYREQGTEFIKASTYASSIAKSLKKVHDMSASKRVEMGRKAREWVLKNFAIEVIGKKFEEILDGFPKTKYDFDFTIQPKHPDALVPASEDDVVWVKSLYKLILNQDVADDDSGLVYWLAELKKGANRQAVQNFFRKVAHEDNAKNQKETKLEDLLGPEQPSERILINIPESLGDCLYITTLLRDARELYKGKKIYVATKPQFRDVFTPLVGYEIDQWIEWKEVFDNSMFMEGYGDQKGFFHVVLQPHFPTQRMINYLHHGDWHTKMNLRYRERIIYPDYELYVGTAPATEASPESLSQLKRVQDQSTCPT